MENTKTKWKILLAHSNLRVFILDLKLLDYPFYQFYYMRRIKGKSVFLDFKRGSVHVAVFCLLWHIVSATSCCNKIPAWRSFSDLVNNVELLNILKSSSQTSRIERDILLEKSNIYNFNWKNGNIANIILIKEKKY